MLKMAEGRCEDILNSFKSDSTGKPDSRYTREDELNDSSVARLRWVEDAYHLTTVKARWENRYYGIYENSFSKHRTRFNEVGRVSLFGGGRR